MNIKKNYPIWLVLVISILASGCLSERESLETNESAASQDLLSGRLLWLSRGENETLTIREYKMDKLSMGILMEGIPYENDQYGPTIPDGVFSNDGKYFMLYSEDPWENQHIGYNQ